MKTLKKRGWRNKIKNFKKNFQKSIDIVRTHVYNSK